MIRERQIEEMAELIYKETDLYNVDTAYDISIVLHDAGYRKQSENETLKAVDMYKTLITNKFIELCNYNDYGKINLLLIGETLDKIFDDMVEKMEGGE